MHARGAYDMEGWFGFHRSWANDGIQKGRVDRRTLLIG